MIVSDKLKKELLSINQNINYILKSNIVTDYRLENFLIELEKSRYAILSELNTYNNNVELDCEKIHTIDSDYRAEYINNILKIYIPETLPSYKNLKTHTYKRILLNVANITKAYKGLFTEPVLIYIKVFDKLKEWDVDNRCIKPISDALVASGVIQDDNIQKMFYCVKGIYSTNPHIEVSVINDKNISNFSIF